MTELFKRGQDLNGASTVLGFEPAVLKLIVKGLYSRGNCLNKCTEMGKLGVYPKDHKFSISEIIKVNIRYLFSWDISSF